MKYLDLFSQRTTVRSYSDRTLSTADLDSLLKAASHAPTTGNMQLCTAVVTRERNEIELLAPYHFNQPCLHTAQAVITFCADVYRFERWCAVSNAKPDFRNLQSLLASFFDATIFAQQFCTLAELNGLGTCYLGTTTYNAAPIAKSLNLPEGVIPVLTVTVGYPAELTQTDAGRLPAEAVVHHSSYRHYTDSEICALYKEKESRPDSQQFIKDNNKETLAQVFTDIRYPGKTSDPFSVAFADFLNNAGFKGFESYSNE
ncbi:MAG: nitroreductase family protein [Muribaculaceae bacterium]|nr:nitroreductase family protein [Muribaculaceae bacterium]